MSQLLDTFKYLVQSCGYKKGARNVRMTMLSFGEQSHVVNFKPFYARRAGLHQFPDLQISLTFYQPGTQTAQWIPSFKIMQAMKGRGDLICKYPNVRPSPNFIPDQKRQRGGH
eukprot:gene442-2436_t